MPFKQTSSLKWKNNEATQASLELMYHVSRELTTALDLRTVLHRVLFLSMRNVGAITGTILVLDDNGQPLESAIITGDQVHDGTTQQLRVTYERGLAGWVARNNQAVLVADTSRDERWLKRPDDARDRTGPKSAISAPIIVRDQLVGVMTLVHPSPGFFTLDHLALVQAIADQAGVAVLNARLYAESQRQARVMTALAESAAVITASLNLEDVLQRILEYTSQALRVEMVFLALIEPQTQEMVFRAATGKQSQAVIGLRLPFSAGIAGWVAKEGRGAVVTEARTDPRYYPEMDRLLNIEIRAVACAPIRYRGQVIGVLEALNPTEMNFDPDALLVLTGIGSLAGTTIRNAQLFERSQTAQQRYRDLFEDSMDPILITDWQGCILEANNQVESISGLEQPTLQQMSIDQLHTIDLECLGADFAQLKSGQTYSYESNLHAKAGQEIPVQVYVRQVQIDGPSQLQWLLRDISERKKLDSLRNDLLAMIYHDLRSPLNNIVSSLDVLGVMLGEGVDPTQRSLLNIALRSTERIQRLTSSLLDIRRMENGQPLGNRQSSPVLALVTEAMEVVKPLTDNKKQTLTSQVPGGLPDIWVDGEMIRRVLINLLENAHKYSPVGSQIVISAVGQGEWVQFSVQDNGPGIPAPEHEHIFDKFIRLNTSEGLKGMGLGLSFCRLAVEGHGGRIWVESEPGAGSCFKFTLPAAEGATSSPQA